MSIEIIKNKDVKLDIPSFTCDENAVGEHLNSHPLLQLLNVYGFLTIIGRPGSGKTSVAISLITQKNPKIYRKTNHHIYIFMPENSLASLEKNPFKVLEKDNIYHELNEATILNVFKKIDANSKKGEKSLILIDDMTASLKASITIVKAFKDLVFNRRHLKCNIIMTVQSFVNIPLDIRKNIQNMILFKPSKKEFELIFDELLEMKKEIAGLIMKYVYDDDNHNFLFVNIPNQRMFKNFTEEIKLIDVE